MTLVSRSARPGQPAGTPSPSGEAVGTPFAFPALLAWGGRAALLLLILTSSCLVPQTVDPSSANPHHPPRIIIDQIPTYEIGPYITLVRASRDTCHCELTLSIPQVADDDTVIDIDGRWFVDYDPQVSSTWGYTSVKVPGSFDDFTKVFRTGPTYDLKPDTLGLADGFHTVEIYLVEDNGFNDAATDPVAPNRTLVKGYEAASYRFQVRVVTDADVPQCPQQAPFKRSCSGGGQ